MSFDEYVNHYSQKQRIAVAISVIKTKPKDLSIDEYLTQLQQKIKDTEFDPNETVCSDDFNFDDDEITDLNHREIPVNINGHQFDYNSNKANTNNSVENESFQDSPTSQTILNDFVFGGDKAINDVNVYENCLENSLETLHLHQGATVDRKSQEQTSQLLQNLSQQTYCESQELNTNDYINDTTNCYTTINDNDRHNSINALENDRNLTNIDSQATELYSLEFNQNHTHVSQTQGELVVISDKFIRSKVDNDQRTELKENTIPIDNGEVDTKINLQQNQFTENGHNNSIHQHDHDQIRTPVENVCVCNNGSVKNIDINKEPADCINIIDYITIGNEEQETNKNHIAHKHAPVRANTNDARNDKEIIEGDNDNDENNEMEVDEKADSDDNSTVKVPFKVLEELHRVKAFLNKKDRRYTDGYSTDSGYRSDSQVRNSFKNSFQSSIIWINQSAHCLFTYIMQSPMDCGDIVNDISKVLGQLIDKLHEEENYPPFLEELLETVDSLIREAYGGDNWTEDALITKDAITHRLVLLNKSKHILKHSTETITDILEKLHSNLTQENQYELTNTSQIENSCYIFHMLEIFLKKYIKVKNSSQASLNSEERFPKRSSLTELWRKKWNPNFKETPYQENVTVCILKKCSEILNKIIVECMDGYSLVSFAALQCFNLIQT